MSERYGYLERKKARIEQAAHVFGDIVRGLTARQSDMVEHVNVAGHHPFNSEATLLLKARTREWATTMLGMFPPVGLDMVELRDGGRAIMLTITRTDGNRAVRSRQTIAPFLYSVVQTRKVARHTVSWAHILTNGIQVAVECDIVGDRAGFTFEHFDDAAHNQVLFRRVPNEYVPEGPRVDARGVEWSHVKDVTASLTVWWPWTHPKVETRRALDKGWPHSVEQLASILLEVREEALGQ